VAPLSLITSAPELTVCWIILSICSFVRSVVIGMPETLAYSISGTMVSPCSPMTMAFTSCLETFSSCAMYVLKRSVSRMLPMPKTWLGGKPDSFRAMNVMMSTGLVTIMSLQSGVCLATSLTIERMTLALLFMRSMRVMSGFRACPAMTMMSSLPSISLKSPVPLIFPSNSIAGADCIMSSASPFAKFS